MILPIRTDSPLRGKPWMNWVLIAANVAVFALDWGVQKLGHLPLGNHYCLNARDPQLSRFLTYAFIHAGWLHLLGNLLPLYIFGKNVNDRLGNVGYLAFYLSGALAAGIGFVLTEDSAVPAVVGASGAVMAVMGAYLALFPRSNITVLSLIVFVGTFEVPSMYLILVFFLLDLATRFAGTTGVAHMAHMAGLLFGFAVGLGLLSVRLLPRDQWDVVALFGRWNRRRQYQTLVRRGYNPFAYVPPAVPVRRPAPKPPPDPHLLRLQELRAEINEAVAHHNIPHAAILFLELRALDPAQVLSRQAQLDVANQLASQQFYAEAAEAYEQFLRHYPKFQQIEQVQLMLGVICARYLKDYPRARLQLGRALQRLHGDREVQMARAELERIEAPSRAAEKGKAEP